MQLCVYSRNIYKFSFFKRVTRPGPAPGPWRLRLGPACSPQKCDLAARARPGPANLRPAPGPKKCHPGPAGLPPPPLPPQLAGQSLAHVGPYSILLELAICERLPFCYVHLQCRCPRRHLANIMERIENRFMKNKRGRCTYVRTPGFKWRHSRAMYI